MEQIISASGTQYGLVVNPDGSINAQTDSQLPVEGDNPAWKFMYSGNYIGSIVQYIGLGSYVQTITYSGNAITNIGSWS